MAADDSILAHRIERPELASMASKFKLEVDGVELLT